MSENNFPKLHNAMWPGLVGKGSPGAEPFIDLDTMLDMTAKAGVTFENTSETEPLVTLRYFGPDVNPDAPAMGAYRKNKFN